MQRYVASRPMFMDSEIMNLDARTVRSEFGQGGLPNLTKGLQTLYKEITGLCNFYIVKRMKVLLCCNTRLYFSTEVIR